MRITPVPFLIAEIFASNIGGAATLIGDPPNIMIGSAAGLSFNEFLINLGPIMAIDLVVVMGMLFLIYRKDLHVSPDEQEGIEKTFADLNERDAIRDWPLFKKSVIVIHACYRDVLHPRPPRPGTGPRRPDRGIDPSSSGAGSLLRRSLRRSSGPPSSSSAGSSSSSAHSSRPG